MQAQLHQANAAIERLEISPGSWISYQPSWLDRDTSDELLQHLMRDLQWEKGQIRLFGKWVDIPRQHAWYGDKQASYAWSGQRAEPLRWESHLQSLREQLQDHTNSRFNGVLANLYRDGQDCMHWHADDEKELGQKPLIAAISLGAERRFALRHKQREYPTHRLQLAHGSLLLMGGDCQQHWQHNLPRSARVQQPRISLTFRWIEPSPTQ